MPKWNARKTVLTIGKNNELITCGVAKCEMRNDEKLGRRWSQQHLNHDGWIYLESEIVESGRGWVCPECVEALKNDGCKFYTVDKRKRF